MVRRSWCSTVVVIAGLTVGMAFAAAPPQLPVEQSLSASSMQWVPGFQYDGATLTVNGRDGIVYRRDFEPGEQLSYGLYDDDGRPLVDGAYTWQLSIRRTLSGSESAALKAATEEARELQAHAEELSRRSASTDVQNPDRSAKAGDAVGRAELEKALEAARLAEENIELVRDGLEMKHGRFAELRIGLFEVRGGSVEFSEDEYAIRDLKASASSDAVDSGDTHEPVGRRSSSGETAADGPGLKDITDAGDIKAGGGLAAGSTTVNPPTGSLYLVGALTDIFMDDPSSNTNDWLFDRASNVLEFESPSQNFNAITYEGSPAMDILWLAANGNVGFRESTPATDIHITEFAPEVRFEDSSDASSVDVGYNSGVFYVQGNSQQSLFVADGGAPANSIYVASTGNVRLGSSTAPPTDGKFTVWDSALPEIVLADTAAGGEWGEMELQSDGDLQFSLNDGTTTRTVVTFDSGGNVGIGTTAPAERLTVFNGVGNASLLFDSAASANFFLDRGNTSSFSRFVFQTNGNLKWSLGMTNDGSDNFTLGPFASVSYFFINQVSGRVGFGTKTPAHPLQMASGAYVSAGGVWTNASSRDFKTDIHELSTTDAFEALSGMQPVLFRYKNTDGERHVGFIAEDVPELVATKDRKGLSTMDVVAVLTKVVQEQQTTIERLEARLAELEAK